MAYQNKFTIQYKESEQLKFTEENMKEVQQLSTNIYRSYNSRRWSLQEGLAWTNKNLTQIIKAMKMDGFSVTQIIKSAK